jgi:hypothetical protein
MRPVAVTATATSLADGAFPPGFATRTGSQNADGRPVARTSSAPATDRTVPGHDARREILWRYTTIHLRYSRARGYSTAWMVAVRTTAGLPPTMHVCVPTAAVAAVVAYERATQQPEPAVVPSFSVLA